MRTRLRSKATVLFVAFAALLLAVAGTTMALTADPSGNTAPAPTIQSDKADYAPGETVTLTGSNWQPGESVHINVNDDVGQTWSYDSNPDVTADANGNIQHQFQLPNSFVATYKVTATGAQSGTATTSFTDGNVKFDAAPTGTTAQFVETLYTGATNCSGAVKSGYPKTLNNSNGDNVGLGNSESLRIDAAAQSDQTPKKDFVAWSTTNGSLFTVIEGTNGRSICIPGNQNGSQNYLATYGFRPVANNDSRSVNEDGTLNVAAPGVLANDTDADNSGNTNAGLTVKDSNPNLAGVQPESQPNNGTLTLNANGSFTYTPNANFNGTDSFTYKATDSGLDSNTATVSITVTPVNDKPTADAQSVTTDEDVEKTITLVGNDVDGDSLTYDIVAGPTHGSLSGSGANLTYTPAADYNGPGSFSFKTNDGTVDSDAATVSITVNSVNDKPVVTNLQGGVDTANEGDLKTYTFTITDSDSSNFSFASGSPNCGGTGKGQVVNGTAQISGTSGTFQCKFLDGGATATQVSVSAQVTDGQASSEAASKNVAVSNVAPKIDSLSGPAQILTNQPVTFTGTHSDPAGLLDNPFTWQWSGGTSTDTDKNNSYVTKFSACGPQNVKATVTDKDTGTSTEATLSTPVQAYNGNFLPPLQVGKDNMVQKGQVVPVKISVAGCDGLNKTGLNPEIRLAKGDPTVGINEADYTVPGIVAAADTSGVMRPVSDGYIYNLRIPSDASVKANDIYAIRVTPFGVLSDQHMVIAIQIRK
jgi:VCBS repeat-containing protein